MFSFMETADYCRHFKGKKITVMGLGFASVLVLFISNTLTPETAVISLPVALVSLLVFQRLFKGGVGTHVDMRSP